MPSIPRGILFAVLLTLPLAMPILSVNRPGAVVAAGLPRPAPAFTRTDASGWINSPPLAWTDLRGSVTLLEVWTWGCWNCTRSIPWIKDVQTRLGPRGLRVVAIHSPEFEHEKDPATVRTKVREFGLDYPVMLDDDFRYWRALDNRYWPAFHLIDKTGRIRAVHVGETHAGTPQARAVEEVLEALLAEPSPP